MQRFGGKNIPNQKFNGKSFINGVFTGGSVENHSHYTEKREKIVTLALRNKVTHTFQKPPVEIKSANGYLNGDLKPSNTQHYPIYLLFDDDKIPILGRLTITNDGQIIISTSLGAPFSVTVLPYVVQYM